MIDQTQSGSLSMVGRTQSGSLSMIGRTQSGSLSMIGRTRSGSLSVIGQTQSGSSSMIGLPRVFSLRTLMLLYSYITYIKKCKFLAFFKIFLSARKAAFQNS